MLDAVCLINVQCIDFSIQSCILNLITKVSIQWCWVRCLQKPQITHFVEMVQKIYPKWRSMMLVSTLVNVAYGMFFISYSRIFFHKIQPPSDSYVNLNFIKFFYEFLFNWIFMTHFLLKPENSIFCIPQFSVS